ncbi:MAG: glycosyltransferase, partial [Candidatus Rokubacteria bacterium]|nr:glycosyltransferase [Candidatus Rokubacteria bacterium]
MRVLYVNHSCVLRVNQQRVAELARFPDLDVTVLSPRRWRDRETGQAFAFESPEADGFDFYALPAYLAYHPILYMYALVQVKRLVVALRPHLVHVEQEPYSACAFQMARLARACGAKVVITALQNLDKRYPLPFRAMEQFTLRAADYVVGVTEETTVLWSRRAGNGKPASTIPLGYDPALYFPRDGSALRRLGLRGFVIGYLGRLIESKGLAMLL